MLLKYYQKLDDTISYLLASTANEGKLLKKIFKQKPIILVDIGSNEGSYIDLVDNNFDTSSIEINIQKVSNDTYLKNDDIKIFSIL